MRLAAGEPGWPQEGPPDARAGPSCHHMRRWRTDASASRGFGGVTRRPHQNVHMLLTIKDVSAWLNIKAATLYLWVAQGKIPSLKLNGLIRFHPNAIEQWLQASIFEAAIRKDHGIVPTHSFQHVDRLIADAKRAVYTPRRGRPDQDRANTKEVGNGSV